MNDLVMGVDSGGTKTVAWLADESGRVLGRGRSGVSNYMVVGAEHAIHELKTAMQAAFSNAGLPQQQVGALCMGLAGVSTPEDKPWLETWAAQENLTRNLVIVNDAYLLFWAGTPEGWGIALIAGTGSIVLGRTPDGNMGQVGGWGYVLGDEGSGYDVGIQALRAITQAWDGRAEETVLTERIMQHWGLKDLRSLVPYVYQKSIQRPDIARLAELVLEAAEEGDRVSQNIRSHAVSELVKSVGASVRGLELPSAVPCAMSGGLLTHHAPLVRAVIGGAHRLGIRLDPVKVVQDPVEGAIRLALKSLK